MQRIATSAGKRAVLPTQADARPRSSIRSHQILDRKPAAHVEHTQVGMKHSCSAGSPSPKRIQPVAMWSWKRSRGRHGAGGPAVRDPGWAMTSAFQVRGSRPSLARSGHHGQKEQGRGAQIQLSDVLGRPIDGLVPNSVSSRWLIMLCCFEGIIYAEEERPARLLPARVTTK